MRGMKTVLFALLALTGAVCSAAELERVVIVPAHPDDLIACLGFCHLARGKYEVHVVDFTHGERGCGEEKFKSGWTKATRTKEEEAVCASIGATLHWLDEVDGEAYASRESCERLAAILKKLRPRAVIAHWPVDIHTDHVMAGAAAIRAVFLADIKPEIYFMEQTYQSKNFSPDVYVDITSVYDKVLDSIRLYACQYGDGAMERRRRVSADFHGWHSADYYRAKAEGYKCFVQPMQGERTIFADLPRPNPQPGLSFEGAR